MIFFKYWLLLDMICLISLSILLLITDRYYVIKPKGYVCINGLNLKIQKVKIIYDASFNTVILHALPLYNRPLQINSCNIGSCLKVIDSSDYTIKMMVRHINIVYITGRKYVTVRIDNNTFGYMSTSNIHRIPFRI